ncbi:hypothetical protein AV955_gp042 [Diadromus pulchellus ascovirus 4a]|uniref:Complete DpAV4 genome n=1 Tax=Diadromus pulchellus ascovirus 4a TaxID=158683 RepID=F2NYX1_9VIRU|nr:hypothetical protein AV955_gp042 [Diadromus pulchellus ascovirus 4a]CCA61399.1 unnamed protein product [Diadromus pulchellus ascovirus 4a]
MHRLKIDFAERRYRDDVVFEFQTDNKTVVEVIRLADETWYSLKNILDHLSKEDESRVELGIDENQRRRCNGDLFVSESVFVDVVSDFEPRRVKEYNSIVLHVKMFFLLERLKTQSSFIKAVLKNES